MAKNSNLFLDVPVIRLPIQPHSPSPSNIHCMAVPSSEVPLVNKWRSSSFDSSSLCDVVDVKQVNYQKSIGKKRNLDTDISVTVWSSDDNCSDRECPSNSLRVPVNFFRRASLDVPKICIHCKHLESLGAKKEDENAKQRSMSFSADDCRLPLENSISCSGRIEFSSSSNSSDREDQRNLAISGSRMNTDKTSFDGVLILKYRDDVQRCSKCSYDLGQEIYSNTAHLEVPTIKPRSTSLDVGHIAPLLEAPRKASLDERELNHSQSTIKKEKCRKESSMTWLSTLQDGIK